MQTILEARDITWQMLEGGVLNSSSIGTISGLVVLPEIRSDGHETRGFDDTANNNAGKTNRRGHTLPSGHNSASGEDTMTRSPTPQKTGVSGVRVVMATCGVSCSTNGLGILEHGIGLDATTEGNIGLPEGSTLFAQRVVLGGADCYHDAHHSRSLTGGNGGTTGSRGNEEMSCCNTTQEGHVLLFSDRVRSKTNILVVSSDGEVTPAVTGTNKVRIFLYTQALFDTPAVWLWTAQNIIWYCPQCRPYGWFWNCYLPSLLKIPCCQCNSCLIKRPAVGPQTEFTQPLD